MRGHNQMLLHAVKAIQYRLIKVTAGSKEHFGDFKAGSCTRTPNEILNHLTDLSIKAEYLLIEGHANTPMPDLLGFDAEMERLQRGLEHLKIIIATTQIDVDICKKLLQGPVMDMATHIGQIAMLNGLHGNKISKADYYNSEIE